MINKWNKICREAAKYHELYFNPAQSPSDHPIHYWKDARCRQALTWPAFTALLHVHNMYKAQICFQCSIPERISCKSLCTQSDVLVFQSSFPFPHSPLAFRVIFSEAEIHNSSEEHSIFSIVRSLSVAGSALARGKPHGASPSRFFPFLS